MAKSVGAALLVAAAAASSAIPAPSAPKPTRPVPSEDALYVLPATNVLTRSEAAYANACIAWCEVQRLSCPGFSTPVSEEIGTDGKPTGQADLWATVISKRAAIGK